MKLFERDLEPSLRSKIDRLSGISETKKSGYVYFDGEKYYQKDIQNQESVLYTEDELNSLIDHLYYTDKNYISLSDTAYNEEYNPKSPGIAVKINGRLLFSVSNSIYKKHVFKDYIIILDIKGTLYRINKKYPRIVDKINILDIITNNYVSDGEIISDITDICLYGTDVIISTNLNGIFKYNFETKELNRIISELNVKSIALIRNDSLLVLKANFEDNVILYNLKTNSKIISYDALSSKFQTVLDYYAFEDDSGFAILGKTYSPFVSDNILHVFIKNSDSYNNSDEYVPVSALETEFVPKFVRYNKNTIYIAGIYENTFCVRAYYANKYSENYQEYRCNTFKMKYSKLHSFYVTEDNFVISYNDKVIFMSISTGKITGIFSIGTYRNIYLDDDNIYAFSTNECFKYEYPKEKNTNKIIFHINDTNACNNIDILIYANNPKVTFVNTEKTSEIKPYATIKYGDYLIIKLKNINIKKYDLCIDTSELSGLLIHNNSLISR